MGILMTSLYRWRQGLEGCYDMRFWLGVHTGQVRGGAPIAYPFSNIRSSEWYSQCVPGSGGAPSNPAPSNPPSDAPSAAGGLHDKFKAKGKIYFGTEIDHYHLNNNPLTTIAKNSFGQITNENSMKWDALEREFPYHHLWLGFYG